MRVIVINNSEPCSTNLLDENESEVALITAPGDLLVYSDRHGTGSFWMSEPLKRTVVVEQMLFDATLDEARITVRDVDLNEYNVSGRQSSCVITMRAGESVVPGDLLVQDKNGIVWKAKL